MTVTTSNLHPLPAEVGLDDGPDPSREAITGPVAICERMARDILSARRGGDDRPCTFVLLAAGWSWSRISRFGLDAQDLALTPAFAAQDVVERLRAAEIEAAAAERLGDALGGDRATMRDDIIRAEEAAR